VKATQRLWKSAGGRLVPDGDPTAVSLAYAVGDELTKHDESLLPADDQGDVDDEKAVDKPADKALDKPADKSGGMRRNK
jgi:hypothetical protein